MNKRGKCTSLQIIPVRAKTLERENDRTKENSTRVRGGWQREGWKRRFRFLVYFPETSHPSDSGYAGVFSSIASRPPTLRSAGVLISVNYSRPRGSPDLQRPMLKFYMGDRFGQITTTIHLDKYPIVPKGTFHFTIGPFAET